MQHSEAEFNRGAVTISLVWLALLHDIFFSDDWIVKLKMKVAECYFRALWLDYVLTVSLKKKKKNFISLLQLIWRGRQQRQHKQETFSSQFKLLASVILYVKDPWCHIFLSHFPVVRVRWFDFKGSLCFVRVTSHSFFENSTRAASTESVSLCLSWHDQWKSLCNMFSSCPYGAVIGFTVRLNLPLMLTIRSFLEHLFIHLPNESSCSHSVANCDTKHS